MVVPRRSRVAGRRSPRAEFSAAVAWPFDLSRTGARGWFSRRTAVRGGRLRVAPLSLGPAFRDTGRRRRLSSPFQLGNVALYGSQTRLHRSTHQPRHHQRRCSSRRRCKSPKAATRKLGRSSSRSAMPSGDEVMRAWLRNTLWISSNLKEVVIPPSVIELVPESVARENAILPMEESGGHAEGDRQRSNRPGHLRQIAIHSESQGGNRRCRREIASSKRSISITARWTIRAPTRCSRSLPIRRSISPKPSRRPAAVRRSRRRDERAIVRLVQLIISEAVQLAGVGHSRRAIREPRSHPLPHRRRAGRTR